MCEEASTGKDQTKSDRLFCEKCCLENVCHLFQDNVTCKNFDKKMAMIKNGLFHETAINCG